jgi:hypothetical protein
MKDFVAQLLAEIADKVMIDGRDLMQLWPADKSQWQELSKRAIQAIKAMATVPISPPIARRPAHAGLSDYPDFSRQP